MNFALKCTGLSGTEHACFPGQSNVVYRQVSLEKRKGEV